MNVNILFLSDVCSVVKWNRWRYWTPTASYALCQFPTKSRPSKQKCSWWANQGNYSSGLWESFPNSILAGRKHFNCCHQHWHSAKCFSTAIFNSDIQVSVFQLRGSTLTFREVFFNCEVQHWHPAKCFSIARFNTDIQLSVFQLRGSTLTFS